MGQFLLKEGPKSESFANKGIELIQLSGVVILCLPFVLVVRH